MAQTRQELDAMGCGSPGCTHDHSVLELCPMCHPNGRKVHVSYRKCDGVLVIRCAKCEAPVGEILVAESQEREAPQAPESPSPK